MEICIVLCIYIKCSFFVCVWAGGGGGRGGGFYYILFFNILVVCLLLFCHFPEPLCQREFSFSCIIINYV